MAPGGPLRLGGIEIAHDSHLVGHSDADVLLHAVTDAVLGACGLSDIGELFPNTDLENKDRDSFEFLAEAVRLAIEQGFRVVNLDCIVFAEKPKLSPYKQQITESLAKHLETSNACVNVKAKTGESVGPVGRGEAIMAECVVLMESNLDRNGRRPDH